MNGRRQQLRLPNWYMCDGSNAQSPTAPSIRAMLTADGVLVSSTVHDCGLCCYGEPACSWDLDS